MIIDVVPFSIVYLCVPILGISISNCIASRISLARVFSFVPVFLGCLCGFRRFVKQHALTTLRDILKLHGLFKVVFFVGPCSYQFLQLL